MGACFPCRFVVVTVLVAVSFAACGPRERSSPRTPLELPPNGPLTIAATGDSLILHPIPRAQQDAAVVGVIDAIARANIALTNLEENLLTEPDARAARSHAEARWPFASAREADELRRLGFDVIALANNHATDYGPDGLADTAQILDEAGLLHVGTGPDLARARAAVFVGTNRRVAVIAVATSAAAESRATPTRGDIKGRPGLNPLRYAADVTADPQTFQTLKDSLPALKAGPTPTDDRQLTFFGTTIKRGDRTSVTFAVDTSDEHAILDQVKASRSTAEVVIVSVHSHEPSNVSETPADFLRGFAHAAIDAGAALVAVHGPHRIRGVETYKGGAILYSLGNFLYQAHGLDFRTADVFDAGSDLYGLAMGSSVNRDIARPGLERAEWWQGLVATVTVDHGVVTTIRLQPIDLGVDLPADARGTPRLAAAPQSSAILDTLGRLSEPYATRIRVDEATGVIEVPRARD